jgi:ribosomal protein S18 acetylase RimI-like enzyme
VRRGRGAIWLYRDANKEIVEFGTIDVCWDYGYVTGGRPHPHIPLLAVKPDMRGKGIGPSIITHLIGEAVLRTHWPAINCYPAVFLEVYTDNLAAMRLYEKTGFEKLSEEPSYDPDEKKHYFVMVKSLSIVPEQGIA